MTYAAIHMHSMYSPDGCGKPEDYVIKAKEFGLAGVGITDHGLFSSALELYEMGKKHQFPVVIGEEFYITDDVSTSGYNHLTVWCKNAQGYKNLCKLSSMAFAKPRFNYKPRITYKDLFAHKDGLIIGSGCFVGTLNMAALRGDKAYCDKYIRVMRKHFGDDFYIEIMPAVVKMNDKERDKLPELHDIPNGVNLQLIENRALLKLAEEHNIKYICSSDAHMPDLRMATLQKVKMLNKSKNWEYDYLYYMRDFDEFRAQWLDEFGLSEEEFSIGCENTVEIVNKCADLKLEFPLKLPKIDYDSFPVKADNNVDLVTKLVKYHNKVDLTNPTYKDRLVREMNVLARNGQINLLDYFLLLEDVCRYCKSNGILVGIGRGSAGGSLLAYALDIIDLDPIVYNMSFERFINATRIKQGTLPDIDTDIEKLRRKEVIDYVRNKYGADKVASFGTIHTMKLKLALRDSIKILDPDMSQDAIDTLCASVPYEDNGKDEDLDEILEKAPPLKNYLAEHPDVMNSMAWAVGEMRQYGVHAAAVAISDTPLSDFVPLCKKANSDEWYTQYPMDYAAKAGLVKYDFLGLKTLSDIRVCMELIKEKTGKLLNPWRDFELDDPKTMEAFSKAHTTTVFQFNTATFSDLLRASKVEKFGDLVALNTLGRPGTYDTKMHLKWIKRRDGASFNYIHPSCEPILKDTYGIILYQEQVMAILKTLAGFDDVEADDIRRAIGKKKTEVIEKYGLEFIKRTPQLHHDIDKEKAEAIWSLIEAFGRYSFNMSHSILYAYEAYICQYLKTNHTLEWWCAVLNNEDEDDKRRYYFKFIKKLIGDYSIDKSDDRYYIDYVNNKIVPPVSSIRLIGVEACRELKAKRPFASFDDFYDRVDHKVFKKNIVANLIIGGLFKDIDPRSELELMEHWYKNHLGAAIKRDGQGNIAWKEWEDKYKAVTPVEIMKMKMDILPYNSISLDDMVVGPERDDVMPLNKVTVLPDGASAKIVGLVLEIHNTKTKKKKESMFFSTIANGGDSVPLTVFPQNAIKYRELFKKGSVVLIDGTVNIWNGKFSIIVERARSLG